MHIEEAAEHVDSKYPSDRLSYATTLEHLLIVHHAQREVLIELKTENNEFLSPNKDKIHFAAGQFEENQTLVNSTDRRDQLSEREMVSTFVH